MSTTKRRQKLESRDLAEIVIGSLVLAFPVAVTEEVWDLSSEISLARTVAISLSSLVFISIFVQTTYRHVLTFESQRQLVARVLAVYGVTLVVTSATLLAIDKLPLLTESLTAIKRTILVAFPASFAATAVDSLGD